MPTLKHLVVVVPGIGGSVLRRGKDVVWDADPRPALATVFEPGRLGLDIELEPTGLLQDLRLLPGWTVVHGYTRLVEGLRRRFDNIAVDPGDPRQPQHNANVVLFPYDFRQSIARAAEVLDASVRTRVGRLFGTRVTQRVIVIAHSMGGLVARYWLGPLRGHSICRALITLGTPHRGAPKALDWLVHGAAIGRWRLDAASAVLRTWPSVYELLPRYRAIQDATTGAEHRPHEVAARVGLDECLALAAHRVHAAIEETWSKASASRDEAGWPDVIPVLGSGHPTLEAAVWDGQTLKVTKDRPRWLYDDDLGGDGTVPAVSAIPLELERHPALWRDIAATHGPIACASEAIDLVARYSVGSLEAVRGVADPTPPAVHGVPRPRLGLDVDEAYEMGMSVPLRARLTGAATKHAARVWWQLAAATPENPQPVVLRNGILDGSGAHWETEIADLGPGTYTLRVGATDAAPRPPDASTAFSVVAP